MKYSLIDILLIVLFNNNIITQGNNVERLISFQYCQYDDDCIEHSVCYDNGPGIRGKCRCKENFILVSRNKTFHDCLPVAEGIGSSCTDDIQCQVQLGTLSICENYVCKCTHGSHSSDDNKCYRTVDIGGICKTNLNCLLDDSTYGFCVVGKCTCNINYHSSNNGRMCIPSVPLGKNCFMTDSCIHTFASCRDGVCRCLVGYIESDDNSVCLKAADAFGSNCTESIQCSAYLKDAICYEGICGCKSAHHSYANECVLDAKLGDACVENKECILSQELLNSVRCTDGICTCVKGNSNESSYGCNILTGRGNILQLSVHISSLILGILIFYISYD